MNNLMNKCSQSNVRNVHFVYFRWEVDSSYCESVVTRPPYNNGPRLLDIMDTAIFDFLIGKHLISLLLL